MEDNTEVIRFDISKHNKFQICRRLIVVQLVVIRPIGDKAVISEVCREQVSDTHTTAAGPAHKVQMGYQRRGKLAHHIPQ